MVANGWLLVTSVTLYQEAFHTDTCRLFSPPNRGLNIPAASTAANPEGRSMSVGGSAQALKRERGESCTEVWQRERGAGST